MMRTRRLSMVTRLLCGAAALAGAAAAQAQGPEGGAAPGSVVAVRVITADGRVRKENPPELPQRAGMPLDEEAVRESLKRLYRSGSYADIRAETIPDGGGVRLDFIVEENFYVNLVRAGGISHSANEALALAALRLEPGTAFRESLLAEALERMRAALREEGFYEAQLEPELTRHPETRQLDVNVRVTEGPRARIGATSVRMLDGGQPGDLLRRSKLKQGDIAKSSRLQGAAERLRKRLFKLGHLSARVTPLRGEYDAATRSVPVTLDVYAGLKARVEVQGAKISDRTLRRILPIYQEGAVDTDLLEEGRRVIRDHLESQGYFDSEVEYAEATDEKTGQQVITYRVQRGERRRLVGVAFTGNRYFGEALLRGQLRILPQSLLSRGRYNRRLLEDDKQSLRELYLANGFRQARVEADVDTAWLGRAGDLFVQFRIEEGPQTLVSSVEITGAAALSAGYLMENAVGSGPGQPFSEFNVAGDRDNILALYFNLGFPNARFEWKAEPDQQPDRMRLSYHIEEGHRTIVKQVLTSGAEHTREAVVRNAIQISPGEPLSLGALVETQRRLYNLGVFSRVQVAAQNPAGQEEEKNLVVLVNEARRYTLGYGFGFEMDRRRGKEDDPAARDVRISPRAIFEIARANVLGRAHTLSLQARASTIQGRALASYTAPSFLGNPALRMSVIGFAEKASDVRTFTSRRFEVSGQLTQRASPATAFAYRYFFRRVSVEAGSLRIDPNQIPLFSQPTRVAGFGAAWIRDRRNNPVNASEGNFNTADLSFSFKSLGSSANFVRLFLQNSTFYPFGRNLVFARSARFGLQQIFGSGSEQDIPLPERFFAGGGGSLRGFALNQAGPRDPVTGFPLGGLALLIFNQELRFPLRFPRTGDRLGGAVFYDAGNTFSRLSSITLRPSVKFPVTSSGPAALPSDQTDYFSHTLGFSLRYATPIGPLRVDIGYLLNPGRFTVTDSASVVELRRVPRLQFFFNIGSMF
jgi:outer membrane protein assembly complex protein YaeT